MTDRVVAVIVSYQPACAALSELIARVRSQVEAIVIVDNTPGAFPCGPPAAELIALGSNRGLAVAQNIGIRRALELNADFVLLLDQDSLPSPTMVVELLEGFHGLVARGIAVAAVGPRLVDAHSGAAQPVVQSRRFGMRVAPFVDGSEVIETEFLIASGSLLPRRVVEEVGLMDESLFIDQIDVEWELRARARGLRLFAIGPATLTHRLGIGDRRIWCGRFHPVPVHAPWRNYYLFRNSLDVFFRRPAPLAWRVDRCKALVIMAVGYSTQVPPRWTRFRMIARGVWHGIVGKKGELKA